MPDKKEVLGGEQQQCADGKGEASQKKNVTNKTVANVGEEDEEEDSLNSDFLGEEEEVEEEEENSEEARKKEEAEKEEKLKEMREKRENFHDKQLTLEKAKVAEGKEAVWRLFQGEAILIAYSIYRYRSHNLSPLDGFLTPFGQLDCDILLLLRTIGCLLTIQEDEVVTGAFIWVVYINLASFKLLAMLFSGNSDVVQWFPIIPVLAMGLFQFLNCRTIDNALNAITEHNEELAAKDLWRLNDGKELDYEFGNTESQKMKLLNRAFSWLKPFKYTFYKMILAQVLNYGSRAFGPLCMSMAIQELQVGEFPTYWLGMFFLASIGEGLGRLLEWKYVQKVNHELVDEQKANLYRHIMMQEIGFFENTSTGELTGILGHHIGTICSGLAWNTRMFTEIIITFIFTIYFCIFISVRLTIASFVFLPLMAWMTSFLGEKQHKSWKKVSVEDAVADKLLNEGISNIRVVKQFNAMMKEYEEYRKSMDKRFKMVGPAQEYHSKFLGVLFFFPNFLKGVVAVGGMMCVLRGDLTLGEVTAFMSYNGILSWMFNLLGSEYAQALRKFGSAFKAFQVMDRIPKLQFTNKVSKEIKGSVELKDVTMCYPKDVTKKVFSGLNLKIEPGETLALVGATGCGKSTIAKMVLRMYDPTEGDVLIDGENLKSYNPVSLYRQITIVPQDGILFARSIRDNITYGLDPKSITDQEVIEAAIKANAHEFISELALGYHTEVGERGVTLSGGQKQRVCIARAIVRKPKILFLDEATSALDSEAEHLVQTALDKIIAEDAMTCVVIAHRLSTVKNADRICVLKKGSLGFATVVEQGTHSELMALGGEYCSYVKRQMLTDENDMKKKKSSRRMKSEQSSSIIPQLQKQNSLSPPKLSKHGSVESCGDSNEP